MAQDITQVNVDTLLRLLNQNVRQMDSALDDGIDAYNRWVAWRAQYATSADAATALNTLSGVTWITATHIDQWASSFSGFSHLSQVANGLAAGSYVAKDCYFDWNKVFN